MSSPPPGNGLTILAVGAILTALVTLLALAPLAPCPACPPSIFTITTNLTVPGSPLTNAMAIECDCRAHGGKVSLFTLWRFRRATS
jgi:hypothetical protein